MFSHYSSESHQPSYCLQTGDIMKFISPNHIYAKDLKHPPRTHHSSCKWYFLRLTETNRTTVYSNISKTSLYIKSLTETLATSSAALCIYCFLEKQHSSVLFNSKLPSSSSTSLLIADRDSMPLRKSDSLHSFRRRLGP